MASEYYQTVFAASQSERVPQKCFYVKVAYLSYGEYASISTTTGNFCIYSCLTIAKEAVSTMRKFIEEGYLNILSPYFPYILPLFNPYLASSASIKNRSVEL